jgi:hypothetical protein
MGEIVRLRLNSRANRLYRQVRDFLGKTAFLCKAGCDAKCWG